MRHSKWWRTTTVQNQTNELFSNIDTLHADLHTPGKLRVVARIQL